jgi:hypothetical protein
VADGRFVTETSGSVSVAVLFAGLKERLQLLCGWELKKVAVLLENHPLFFGVGERNDSRSTGPAVKPRRSTRSSGRQSNCARPHMSHRLRGEVLPPDPPWIWFSCRQDNMTL